jgi:hypothetical protein
MLALRNRHADRLEEILDSLWDAPDREVVEQDAHRACGALMGLNYFSEVVGRWDSTALGQIIDRYRGDIERQQAPEHVYELAHQWTSTEERVPIEDLAYELIRSVRSPEEPIPESIRAIEPLINRPARAQVEQRAAINDLIMAGIQEHLELLNPLLMARELHGLAQNVYLTEAQRNNYLALSRSQLQRYIPHPLSAGGHGAIRRQLTVIGLTPTPDGNLFMPNFSTAARANFVEHLQDVQETAAHESDSLAFAGTTRRQLFAESDEHMLEADAATPAQASDNLTHDFTAEDFTGPDVT